MFKKHDHRRWSKQLKKSDIFISSMTCKIQEFIHPSCHSVPHFKKVDSKEKKTMYFRISIIRLGRISPNWVLYESILQIVPFSLNDGWE